MDHRYFVIAHAPDSVVAVLAEEQAAVFRDSDSDRAPPDFSFRRDEASDEVFVFAVRLAGRFVDGHADNLVSGAARLIPGAVERGEEVAFVFRRKLPPS